MEENSLIESYPWIQWNVFYTLSHNPGYKDIINNLKDDNKKILGYNNGWLVIKNVKMHQLYLINANSLEKIKLPYPNFTYDICILTRSPTHVDCYVFFITENSIRYCRLGHKKYKLHTLEESMHIMCDTVAVLEGKVYYMVESAFPNLVTIECNRSTLRFNKIETLPLFTDEVLPRCYRYYLVESNRELLLVLRSYPPICPKEDVTDVDFFLVFQFDFVNKSWMQLDNIANSTIFIPNGSCYGAVSFCATQPQIRRNSIYFLKNDDEYIHVYDMNDHSFSLFSNGFKKVTMQIQDELNGNLRYEEKYIEFLPRLHSDLSKLVLARLFTIDPGALGAIHCTRKDWRSIVRPPTPDIDLRYHKYPYLMTLVKGKCHFFHPTYEHTYCSDAPELLGSHIMFSNFGWLLLCRNIKEPETQEYFFFNPSTSDKISLPNPDPIERFRNMSFSSPPTSSDCFVVAVDFFGCTLAIFKRGENSWKFFDNLPLRKRVVSKHPVFYNQQCYFIGCNNNLIVVDLITRNLRVIGKTFLSKLPMFDESFLVEDGGALLGVFMTTENKIPYLMRMDLSQKKKKWQHVENLKNKMIYVSHAACKSVSAPTNSTGNKIYFPLFRNSTSIFYSVFTKKYHSFSVKYSRETPFDARWKTNCVWIDPT